MSPKILSPTVHVTQKYCHPKSLSPENTVFLQRCHQNILSPSIAVAKSLSPRVVSPGQCHQNDQNPKKRYIFSKLSVWYKGFLLINWSEISPFVPFLDKKQLKKDYVLGAKNVTFFQNCRSGTGGFC